MRRFLTALLTAAALYTAAGAARADGKSEQQPVEALPAAVKAAFDKDFPNAKIVKVMKETYEDGTVHWEIKFTDANGKKSEVEYDQEGKRAHDDEDDDAADDMNKGEGQ